MIIQPNQPEPSEVEANSQIFTTPRERLEFYRREIASETSNLANRTNAYLTAQSFLVIAYGSCMANVNPEWGKLFTLVVPATLALFGVLCSINAWPGIKAACDTIDHWHAKQKNMLDAEPVFGTHYDDSPLLSSWESNFGGLRKSLRFSKRTPFLFSGLWLFLGCFSIWLQLPTPS
ncbi:MAG: hypothetical protein V7756_10885 [Halopseudomonas sp.]|uniref:hypothetical protein n=1 Tax=Halopseudomonas sp. TaxID=2901191 RepID=UPI0030017EC0